MTPTLPILSLGRLVLLLYVLNSGVSLGEKAELSQELWQNEESLGALDPQISEDATKAVQNWSTRPREDYAYGWMRRSMAEDAVISPDRKDDSSTRAKKWALGIVSGLVAGALVGAVVASFMRFLCLSIVRKSPVFAGPIIFDKTVRPKMLAFLDNDDYLSESVVLWSGGGRKVYKAKVEIAEGKVIDVAIKAVEVSDDESGQKQIRAELETLGWIRHRNLVALLAYFHRRDLHLLIYPYMPNGSLHDALVKVEAGKLELPWPVRHQIAVSTAKGLSYLHFHITPTILHRDLKPSNILLDENFVAHVADFGLARVLPAADTHVSDSGVPGTRGYIAPEYHQTCMFTARSDVYSFGVVLAVLLTGRDPTDIFFHTVPGGDIGGWLHHMLQTGNGAEAIHPSLTDPGEYREEILLAMKIAVFCTNNNPAERPTIRDVLIMLAQIHGDEAVAGIPPVQSSLDERTSPWPIPQLITSSG